MVRALTAVHGRNMATRLATPAKRPDSIIAPQGVARHRSHQYVIWTYLLIRWQMVEALMPSEHSANISA
ncbi:uncharacterized protein PHALS_15365 [Plasmopara halstedii]|uniref:Uncharacterized protein n=1 Tax=Plasmopara halstedii TaxID=4781 RepID=A0A0P1ADZ8_PLAHL|nr:uncharacterized protein PHALS_15365 [Plasmopara halstedii]CEG39222.1 hypothetical protein PHALS_15365 [Plasmopara halstedii]|eukprot:XP_024575591.1 hypothetical protein PHALS_15365 [Plasmopara halstedii]